ncbi:hypothetical protein GOP47_0003179 [Adiantum capillus-veneris]|uniref:START domain-containing protein n=1 Tax=Adiantum capillus-veneris TaxID=13818 RepID=A0A9D4VD12_ADICA|nr:hypothetical protein GOP47_0003179 [Adiantum capillus-veneris]
MPLVSCNLCGIIIDQPVLDRKRNGHKAVVRVPSMMTWVPPAFRPTVTRQWVEDRLQPAAAVIFVTADFAQARATAVSGASHAVPSVIAFLRQAAIACQQGLAAITSFVDSRSSGAAYEGWLYHVGVSSLGYQFCRSRYLTIKGKRVEMYTCNPHERPGKPVRCGVVGSNMMVEELGRQIFHSRALYVLRIYSLLDSSKQGKLACSSAGEAQKWLSAFQHAKEEALYESAKGSGRAMFGTEEEFKLSGSSRYRSRSSFKLPRQSVKIGRGPESLLLRPSMVAQDPDDMENEMLLSKHHESDTVEQEKWKCVMTVNGLRFFEDISRAKKGRKGSKFMKSVGVVEATPDQVFDMIMTLDKHQRLQWDVLTGDLELVKDVDGHSDIAHGVYDPKYYRRWCLKKDFLFLRRWRHDQDGSFCITEDAAAHKKCPRKFFHRRVKLNPTVWEICPLPSRYGTSRSLVTQIMEIKFTGCQLMQKLFPSNFQTTTPYFLLCRTAGLREFFAASNEASVDVEPAGSCSSLLTPEGERTPQTIAEGSVPEVNEQFYDAIALDDLSGEEDGESQEQLLRKSKGSVLGSSSWTLRLGLPSKRPPCREDNSDLILTAIPVDIDVSFCKTSLRQGHGDGDSDCWTDPGGQGFMVRGRTYIQDNIKVPGGDPLLKLLGVDWFRDEKRIDMVAKHPHSLVKSAELKKLPFVLIFNLQIPAKPNYSLVFYYGAHKPINPGSLLHRFVTGDDAFRNSRLKLIPRIVEGYWVVKRAVGTKACLLGRALTCNYHSGDNFLEIDVDVGSSSVARSVCGLVLNYATTVVIDFAMLIEGVDETELPEYLLGASRIHKINPSSATPFESM